MACQTNEIENESIFPTEDMDGFNVCSQSSVKIVKVVPLPHARSEVWSYFGFIADDDGEINDKKKTICKICATTLCYSGNTTNLFTHLKAMHPEVNPQKLAPTNKAPRTGKKLNKRKYCEETGNLIPIEIDSNSHQYHVVRNISFNSTTPESEGDQSIISTNLTSNESTNLNSSNSINSNLNKPVINQIINSNVHTTRNQPNDYVKLSNNKSNSTTFALINDQINQTSTINQSYQTNDEQITDAIVNLIVRDCRPIDLVTSKYFEELIKLLAPNYKIPQTQKLESLVKKKYVEVRREMILKSMDDN